MKRLLLFVVLLAVLAVLALLLTGGPPPGDIMVRIDDISLDELDEVPAERWQAVARKRVFFGHQSVGADILAGLAAIQADRPVLAFKVVSGGAEALGSGPGFAEAKIGQNRDPEAKIRDFVQQVRGAGAGFDVAFMKLCYIDVVGTTDANALFTTYRDALAQLAADLPATRLMHCTVPLTSIRTGWKSRAKRLLGKVPNDDADNRVRMGFNSLMRAEYGGKGTLIDLAAAESTLPDGTAVSWQTGDTEYACLAHCYTTDGGHLNEVGQRAVAREVLQRLQQFAGE